MNKFFVKDCPEDKTLFQWISTELKFEEAKKDIGCTKSFPEIISLRHNLNIEELKNYTIETLTEFETKGWQTTKGESKTYGGLSMVFNPDLNEQVDPNQSTLGTKLNSPDEFYYGRIEKFSSSRNTYFDSYGFRKLSPCINQSNLKNFLNEFKLSPTRSRIATLNGRNYENVGEEFLWHKDEEIFENLRINIPIDTNEFFLFQLENQEPIHLQFGNCYTWDTHNPHRVYMNRPTEKTRIHLVLGFMPWIKYNSSDDSFEPNEYFGNLHPFDILLNGLAHDMIGNK
jgi:hypothetical protein